MKFRNWHLSTYFLFGAFLCACGGGEPDNITSGGNVSGGGSGNGNEPSTPTVAELKLSEYNMNNLTKLGVKSGNFSGITYLGNNRYAIADDMAYGAGFVLMDIEMSPVNGKMASAEVIVPSGTDMSPYDEGHQFDYLKNNDVEGIVYYPAKQTVFVIFEAAYQDPAIKEFDLAGIPTGREMQIPEEFIHYTDADGKQHGSMQEIYGFESLAYNENTKLFWTTTENSLMQDMKPGDKSALCRIQSFGEDLQPKHQYLYRTDDYTASPTANDTHIWGISEMVALDDGKLIVMERESFTLEKPLSDLQGSWTNIKLYAVDPTKATPGQQLEKKLLYTGKTVLDPGKDKIPPFADYEGMCLGPKLSSGQQSLLLIADSQGGQGIFSYRLQDYIKVFAISQ